MSRVWHADLIRRSGPECLLGSGRLRPADLDANPLRGRSGFHDKRWHRTRVRTERNEAHPRHMVTYKSGQVIGVHRHVRRDRSTICSKRTIDDGSRRVGEVSFRDVTDNISRWPKSLDEVGRERQIDAAAVEGPLSNMSLRGGRAAPSNRRRSNHGAECDECGCPNSNGLYSAKSQCCHRGLRCVDSEADTT